VFYNNKTLQGTGTAPVYSEVNFNWGTGVPIVNGQAIPGIGSDNFSVRWRGEIEISVGQGGNYRLRTASDDGVRVRFRGSTVIDDWNDHGVTDNTYDAGNLVPGKYSIEIDYYENAGDAVIQLNWSRDGAPFSIVPRQNLYPPTPVFATNTPHPTATRIPSWYVTCYNLTGPLTVRDNWQNGQSIGFVDRGQEVVRPNLIEYVDGVYIRIAIYFPVGQFQTLGYVAIRDTQLNDGDYVTPSRDSTCPVATATPTPSPTPTPSATFDPNIPRHSPGRFGQGIPQIGSVFGSESPATIGALRIHAMGTVDVMPKAAEYCIDSGTETTYPQCDPTDGLGVPVYAPISGLAYRQGSGVIFIYPSDTMTSFPEGRREIFFAHLDPNTISYITDVANAGAGPTPIAAGTIIGRLCRDADKDRCDVSSATMSHLAINPRFYFNSPLTYTPATDSEILGFLAQPSCLFDLWANVPGVSTPQTNPLHACPS
jgi:hypothetical protein